MLHPKRQVESWGACQKALEQKAPGYLDVSWSETPDKEYLLCRLLIMFLASYSALLASRTLS